MKSKRKIRDYGKLQRVKPAIEDSSNEGSRDSSENYLGQLLPNRDTVPNCEKCGSDEVAGIFYGSTPSGGHDDKGNPVPSDKPFHPCREFAEVLAKRNIILERDAAIDRKASRPMWHCLSCGHNFG